MHFHQYGLAGRGLKFSGWLQRPVAPPKHCRQNQPLRSKNQTYTCSFTPVGRFSLSLNFLVIRYTIRCQVLSQEFCDKNSFTCCSHSSRSVFSSSSAATLTNSSG